MSKAYYHVTKPEFVDKIISDGLKPSYGSNSQAIGDNKNDKICLCTKPSIDAWCIMLGTNNVLEVTLPDDFPIEHIDETDVTDEYVVNKPIPAEYITRHFTVMPSQTVLDALRRNYIGILSYFCELCARCYTEGYYTNNPKVHKDTLEAIKIFGECIIPVIPKLGYEKMPREEKKQLLRCMGDEGEYTFCDEYVPGYNYTKPVKRLYQMLPLYEADNTLKLRRKIHNLIKQNFKYCLRTNTGGWTG